MFGLSFGESGLVPKEICVKQRVGLRDCWHGKRHVMYLDDNALPETWHDFQVEEVDIAVFFADVAGIDEEYIISGQFLE